MPAELIYSRGAAGLGALLALPHLQEVQDILGQLLVVVQYTLQCSRGVSTPKPHSKPTLNLLYTPHLQVELQALPALLQHFGHPVGDMA